MLVSRRRFFFCPIPSCPILHYTYTPTHFLCQYPCPCPTHPVLYRGITPGVPVRVGSPLFRKGCPTRGKPGMINLLPFFALTDLVGCKIDNMVPILPVPPWLPHTPHWSVVTNPFWGARLWCHTPYTKACLSPYPVAYTEINRQVPTGRRLAMGGAH